MTLYLKYRPSEFESLVGQKFVKETLKQAIAQDKLVGAYLFCGPRGTGKTSSARIFAKSMNCLHPVNGEACGKCEICEAFASGSLVDIIEIDAASYTWVDNIREIIERAQFSPTQCRYKVYIIDEVHMLSKGAFNALLKILEEPPSHLKFILATTEIHKIPETILSRCQRYDFRSISKEDLEAQIRFIAWKEKIEIDQASVNYIVKASGGGMRNAISLLEQMIENGKVEFTSLQEKLWIPRSELLEAFANKLLTQDRSVVADFEEISYQFQVQIFVRELLFLLRDLLLTAFKDGKEVSRLVFLLQTLDQSYIKMKNSFDAKTTFLVALIECLEGKAGPASVMPEKKVIPQTPKPTPIPQAVTVEAVSPEPIPQKEEPIETLSVHEAMNVFAVDLEHMSENPPVPEHFPVNTLADLLKKKWAKWALTMAVRGSKIQVSGHEVHIYASNAMVRKSFEWADTQALLTQALAEMGYQDASIQIL